MEKETTLGLTELIDQVKQDLLAQDMDSSVPPLFSVDEINLELQVAVEKTQNAGINISVLQAGGGKNTLATQKIQVKTILENLARMAKAERLQGIAKSKTSRILKSNIKLILKKENASGQFLAAEPESNGMPVYYDGDLAELTMVNELDTPVYVYLFNIGVDYSIVQLYPPADGASEKLMPDFPFDVGEKCYGGPLPLALPENYLHDEGINNPILFVTLEEADFSSLTQTGVRSVDDLGVFRGSDSELGKLLTMSLFGSKQRNFVVPRKRNKDSQWAAVSSSFVLRRR